MAPAENGNDAPPKPFDVPIFKALWLANMASNFGTLIQSVGAAWLMTTLSHAPIMVTLVQSSTTLPIMLLSLFFTGAGRFVSLDYWIRRHFMGSGQPPM